jgi:hypothetical protein
MGQQLEKYYQQAHQLGGFKAQMRMAIITKIPITKTKDLPDSNENIKKFDLAMNELRKEFK